MWFRTLLFCLVFGVFGCSTIQRGGASYFERLEKIPLGSNRNHVFDILGPPSVEEAEDDYIRLTYTVTYKRYSLPKVIIWLDQQGTVYAKHIKLFEDDAMTRSQIENHFKDSKFTVRDAPLPKNGHTIPSEKYLDDVRNGIVVEVRPHHANRVSYIHWVKSATSVSSP